MEDQSGIDQRETWLRSLAPRVELVARMALRLRLNESPRDKSYFPRISSLINKLDLGAEELSAIRADAQRVAALWVEGGRAWTGMVEQTVSQL